MNLLPPPTPPALPESIVCSISAAISYEIPANILLAVAEKESGKPGQWVRNTNGTHDVGVMQFNTSYLAELSRYGIRPEHVAAKGCYPYQLAAWRLRGHIKNDTGDIWTRAANYHSRTHRFNMVYRTDLMTRANKWADWLETYLTTGETRLIKKNQKHTSTTYKANIPINPVEAYTAYTPRKIETTTAFNFSR